VAGSCSVDLNDGFTRAGLWMKGCTWARPEPLSPDYRSRVLRLSHACRSNCVKDVPEPHTSRMSAFG
jgi:hypothetical protein